MGRICEEDAGAEGEAGVAVDELGETAVVGEAVGLS